MHLRSCYCCRLVAIKTEQRARKIINFTFLDQYYVLGKSQNIRRISRTLSVLKNCYSEKFSLKTFPGK